MKRAIFALLALLALSGAAAPAAAQAVRGVVVDPGGIPVPGVVVQALDAAGAITGKALTNERGEFLLVAGKPGTYTVRTLRIGFKPVTSDPISLAAGEERSQRFELAGIPVVLSSVRVDGDAVCGNRARDSTAVAFAAWEQVRTALAATQLTTGARGITVTTIAYERALSPDERVILHDDHTIRTERVRTAWLERAPALLHAQGYVVEDAMNGVTYYMPGLDMLGSDAFLEDHCVRLNVRSGAERIGIAFEPVGDRRDIPEVQGTAWLDRRTSELRSVEYRYVNLAPERREANSGGAMEFARFTNGEWAIAKWKLQMPVLEQVTSRASMGGVEVRLAEVRVVGAEMTVARRGADTLWARSGLPMSGTVTDSLTGKAVSGATVRLAGFPTAVVTDARGRYTIPGVIPGEYTLEVHTASLDSVKAVHQTPVAFIDTTVATDVEVLDGSYIRRAMAARNAAAFSGTVTDSANHPIPGVEVTIADVTRSATTGPDGTFRINEVPAGVHQVLARRVGLGAYSAPVSFLAGHLVQRKIVLSRITELNTVNVRADAAASTLPTSFADHRKLGLGTFITRDDIARLENSELSLVLRNVPGLAVVNGHGGPAWALSMHATPELCGPGQPGQCVRTYVPAGFEIREGMKAGCYAQVYLDKTLMNPGAPTEPFDINAVPLIAIEGIEYFPGPSSTPIEYNNFNSSCGVLVIHTRRTP